MLSYFYIFTPTPPPQLGRVVVKKMFSTVREISRIFDPLKSPWDPWVGLGQFFLGLNDSQINPHACQIWSRSDGRVEKGGY